MDVQALRKDIVEKEAQISSLKADLTKVQQAVMEQTRELKFQDEYIVRLKMALRARASDLKVDERVLLSILNSDKDRRRVEKLEIENAQLQTKNATCKQLITEITNATKTARNALAERQEEIKHLRAQLIDMHRQKNSNELLLKEIQQLTERKDHLEEQVHKLLEENSSIVQLNNSLQAVQKDFLIEHGQLNDEYKELLHWKKKHESSSSPLLPSLKNAPDSPMVELYHRETQTSPMTPPMVPLRTSADTKDIISGSLDMEQLNTSDIGAPSYGVGPDKSQTISSFVERIILNSTLDKGSKTLDGTCQTCIGLYKERDRLKAEINRLNDELVWINGQFLEDKSKIDEQTKRINALEAEKANLSAKFGSEIDSMTILLKDMAPKCQKMIDLIIEISKNVINANDYSTDEQKILKICDLIISSEIPEVMSAELQSIYATTREKDGIDVRETPAILQMNDTDGGYNTDNHGIVLNSPTSGDDKYGGKTLDRVNALLDKSLTYDYSFGSYVGDADLISVDQKLKELHKFLDVHSLQLNG